MALFKTLEGGLLQHSDLHLLRPRDHPLLQCHAVIGRLHSVLQGPNSGTVMNRSRSKRNQILELRLGQSEPEKEATLASNRNRGTNAPIVVEDDDDVVVSSPRSFALARSSVSQRSSRIPTVNEEDLELRLGLTVTGRTSADHNPRRRHSRVPPNKTIVLCDDAGEGDQSCSKKRKTGQQLSSDVQSDESKEVKLTCAICMSTMEEETSTVCGHIFCKKCITNAIHLWKRCPTCRKKLTISSIHRIYISSSTG